MNRAKHMSTTEMLDAFEHIGLGTKYWLTQFEDRIRATLQTHELVPVDALTEKEPFDPTLRGFKVEKEYSQDGSHQISWISHDGEWRMIKTWSDDLPDFNLMIQAECGGQDGPQWEPAFDGPCPESQRDLEALLRLCRGKEVTT